MDKEFLKSKKQTYFLTEIGKVVLLENIKL